MPVQGVGKRDCVDCLLYKMFIVCLVPEQTQLYLQCGGGGGGVQCLLYELFFSLVTVQVQGVEARGVGSNACFTRCSPTLWLLCRYEV